MRDTVMRDTESSPRILIVDDDFELRRFLQGEFLVEGFAVGEADTGLSALTQLRDNPNPSIWCYSIGPCPISVVSRSAAGFAPAASPCRW